MVCCVNNAWKLFKNKPFDCWIHSGDFPFENRPKIRTFKREISHTQYKISSEEIVKKLGAKCRSPQHYLGYTIFFLGLYWVLNDLNPKKISLLGFDHDYNSAKVAKWNNHNRPNPQNNFNKDRGTTIEDWSESFFKGFETDSFYGHGTPDPIRLGEQTLKQKFELAIKNTEAIGVKMVNLSPVVSRINTIQKEDVRKEKQ